MKRMSQARVISGSRSVKVEETRPAISSFALYATVLPTRSHGLQKCVAFPWSVEWTTVPKKRLSPSMPGKSAWCLANSLKKKERILIMKST